MQRWQIERGARCMVSNGRVLGREETPYVQLGNIASFRVAHTGT